MHAEARDEPLYDVAILGAGVAGLCLARALADASGAGRTILLVDGARDDDALRTLSFWSTGDVEHEGLVRHAWRRLDVVDEGGAVTRVRLAEQRYRTLFFADLQRAVKGRLAQDPRHRVVDGRAGDLATHHDHVAFEVDGRAHRARWVFDSRLRRAALRVDGRRWHLLAQRFHGWVVRTERDAFDPATAVFLDFRAAPLERGTAFFYVLPFGPREALVELVSLRPVDAREALSRYLRDVLGVGDARVVDHEAGTSLLTEQPFERRLGPRTRAIGLLAGCLKASSGYAFTRILDDTRAIVRSLDERGHPFEAPPRPALYRALDGVLLELWGTRPAEIPAVFRALFRSNPGDRVLRFLDERASWWDLAVIVATLPLGPFVVACARWLLRRLGLRRDSGAHEPP